MGYNTAILIINDNLSEIEKHPKQFVDNLVKQINNNEEDYISVGNCCNPVQVMKTEHADMFRLYCSNGNNMIELSPYNSKLIKKCKQTSWIKKIILNDIKQAQNQLKDLKKLLNNLDK